MVKNYLKITLRSLAKSKVFVIINVIGMGVSLAWRFSGFAVNL